MLGCLFARRQGRGYVAALWIFILSVTSCGRIFDNTPFSHVADSYSLPKDSLKRAAAEYLGRYADFHYGRSRYLVDVAGRRVPDMNPQAFTTDTLYRAFLDSSGYRYVESGPVFDSDTITEDYIRENIELAFDSWRKPWAKDVSFADFCTYILPYRNADEELSGWRRYFKNKYEASILDSVSNPRSMRAVVAYLMRRLEQDIAYGTQLKTFYKPFMTPHQDEMMHTLGCQELAHYGTLALRACGVPCQMIDIGWRFTEVDHSSILIPRVGSNESLFRVSIHDSRQVMPAEKDTMASWRSMAYTYEVDSGLLDLRADTDVISGFGNPVTRRDVTSLLSTTHTLTLPVPEEWRGKKHLFLCRFVRWQWEPIREGRVQGDSVVFRQATIRQWYRLAAMDGKRTIPFGGTFTLTGDGRVMKYDCTGDSALFKMVYNCEPDETRLTRHVTTYFWGHDNRWHPVTQDAVLWGLNEKTGEYRVFKESMRGRFKPVFHLLTTWQPSHTVFYDDETPRPLGFIVQDLYSKEGYFMQF